MALKENQEYLPIEKSINEEESMLVHELSRYSKPLVDRIAEDSDEELQVDKIKSCIS